MPSSTTCRRRWISRTVRGGETEEEESRKADDERTASPALAFKMMTDPFVGQLTFCASIPAPKSTKGDTIYNPVKGKKERIGRIVRCTPTTAREIEEFWPATSPPVSA